MFGFLNYYGEYLTEFVLKSNNIKDILTNNEFLNHILKSENHYAFVWLIQRMDDDLINLFLNPDFLDRLLLDERANDKYNCIITSAPNVLEKASGKVIKYLINSKEIYFIYDNLNLVVANMMLDYIIEKDDSKFIVLRYLSPEVQLGLMSPNNIEKIMQLKNIERNFQLFSYEVIIKFLEYDRFMSVLLNSSKNELVILSGKIKGHELPKELANNKKLVKAFLSVENPAFYRNIVKNLLPDNYNLVCNLEEKRKEYVDEFISGVNDDGIFKGYINSRDYFRNYEIEKLPEEFSISASDAKLKEITTKRLFENIIDITFKDYPRNVLLNIHQMLNFINQSKEEIIPFERKIIYEQVLSFNKLTMMEIKELYTRLKKCDDFSALFYKDIRGCKNKSYAMFNDSFLKINKRKHLRNEKMSRRYDCDVYLLDGEDFVACVTVGEINKYSKSKTMSLSVIGKDNIETYYEERVIVGFEYLDPNRIMHMYYEDSYTSHEEGTNKVNQIFTPRQLLKSTNIYNEILYSEMSGGLLLPSYVVCKDKIDEKSLSYARRNNLPIILINTNKYKVSENLIIGKEYQEYGNESIYENYFDNGKSK